MDDKRFYVGIETTEGGVRTSATLRAFESIEDLRAYCQGLLETYPDGHLFIREL